MQRTLQLTTLCLLGLPLLAGCPDDPSPTDGALPDAGELGLTEAGKALCSDPGTYCTPANLCGLNPKCSNDGVCEISGRRDCDDGINCTVDSCVHGGCEHKVNADTCLNDGTCYKTRQTQGCGRCDPKKPRRWSPIDGVACDDNNPCTKGDVCRDGVCLGQAYNCSDNLACTTDSCDGLGGCAHVLKSTFCQIEKACYKHLETDLSGCKLCDISVSQHAWQQRPVKSVCTIDNKCYNANEQDSSGCFVCDLHAPNQWTPATNRCLIGQLCLKQGVVHPSQCATCDPISTTKQWTPITGATLKVTTFTTGLEGFSASPAVKGVGWQLSSARSTSVPQSLYYGDKATQSYDNGKANSGTATSQAVTLPAGQKAFLTFQLYIDAESTDNYDVLSVLAGGKVLWTKSAKTVPIKDYRRWIQITVDLSVQAGTMVKLAFVFDTKDDQKNKSEGVYIDDVTLLTGCGTLQNP